MKQLQCEICREIIGFFDPKDLAIPITGSMFKSKDPEHGLPDPFWTAVELDWREMRCPYCSNRPFVFDAEKQPNGPDRVLTPEGYWNVNVANGKYDPVDATTLPQDMGKSVDPMAFPCKLCPRSFPTRMGLVGHMKAHRGKKR